VLQSLAFSCVTRLPTRARRVLQYHFKEAHALRSHAPGCAGALAPVRRRGRREGWRDANEAGALCHAPYFGLFVRKEINPE
jgi:hypothetical protein